MKTLNVIVPCYNEEPNVRDFYTELMKTESFFAGKDVTLSLTYIDGHDATSDRLRHICPCIDRNNNKADYPYILENMTKAAKDETK